MEILKGLVSTIIPVHNRASMLREAVASVLAQSYRPIEVIIVDDGSTDDTPDAIRNLVECAPDIVRAVRQVNLGPGAAREAGRLLARGEFIQHLDSDDLILPNKFELQVKGLQAHPWCGVSYGMTRFYRLGEEPRNTPHKRTGECFRTLFPSFLVSRWWSTSTPLFSRKVIDLNGPWLALRCEEDWEYECRIASYGVQLHWCREFVSDTRSHSGERSHHHGTTNRKKLEDRAEAHRQILAHAKRAGISASMPEMEHFLKALFLLARQCGAAGLVEESRSLFRLARQELCVNSGQIRGFRSYYALTCVVGWRMAGRLCMVRDKLLSGKH